MVVLQPDEFESAGGRTSRYSKSGLAGITPSCKESIVGDFQVRDRTLERQIKAKTTRTDKSAAPLMDIDVISSSSLELAKSETREKVKILSCYNVC